MDLCGTSRNKLKIDPRLTLKNRLFHLDLESSRPLAYASRLPPQPKRVLSVSFNEKGDRLVTGGADSSVRIYDSKRSWFFYCARLLVMFSSSKQWTVYSPHDVPELWQESHCGVGSALFEVNGFWLKYLIPVNNHW